MLTSKTPFQIVLLYSYSTPLILATDSLLKLKAILSRSLSLSLSLHRKLTPGPPEHKEHFA